MLMTDNCFCHRHPKIVQVLQCQQQHFSLRELPVTMFYAVIISNNRREGQNKV